MRAWPITPLVLASSREIAIVDIRGAEERQLMGFIPGALPISPQILQTQPQQSLAVLPPQTPVAISCLRGHRSAPIAEWLAAQGIMEPVYTLEGGVLAWQSAGLPLCNVSSTQPDPVTDISGLIQLIRSCFVAESVEAMLSNPAQASTNDGFNPRKEVERILAEALEQHPDQTVALSRVIERLAVMARRHGHPLEHIVANVDRLNATIQNIADQNITDATKPSPDTR